MKTVAMLDPDDIEEVAFAAGERPMLQIVVDAEEEFDWNQPFSRTSKSVSSIRQQGQAHYTFDRYGVVPTYVVDYPVASQRDGYGLLKEMLADGKCEIGAQLHPWVNPPHDEPIGERNSYPGNLPAALEEEKLKRLTGAIEESFGVRPTVYRAGRYGIGPNTAEILARLGYQIDTSVLPARDLSRKSGPDFSHCTARPYWFGPDRRLLELPLTAGVIGAWAHTRPGLYPIVASPLGEAVRLTAILARLKLLDRITLTPEGVSIDEAKRLTRELLADGHRVFSVSYHSPSLVPGFTPYVRDTGDFYRLLGWLEKYLAFFTSELGGRVMTARTIRDVALRQKPELDVPEAAPLPSLEEARVHAG